MFSVICVFTGVVCFCFSSAGQNVADKTRNVRHRRLRFHVTESATMHGLAGYFDSALYGDVHISILPRTFSHGMFSWFPIYFPFKTPIYLTAGSDIEVDMWRCVSEVHSRIPREHSVQERATTTPSGLIACPLPLFSLWVQAGGKVWYEWCLSKGPAGVASAVHNPGGRSYWIGL